MIDRLDDTQKQIDHRAIETGLGAVKECLRHDDMLTAKEICQMTLCIIERRMNTGETRSAQDVFDKYYPRV